MKTKQTHAKTISAVSVDPLWGDIKAGLESALHGKLRVLRPRTPTK